MNLEMCSTFGFLCAMPSYHDNYAFLRAVLLEHFMQSIIRTFSGWMVYKKKIFAKASTKHIIIEGIDSLINNFSPKHSINIAKLTGLLRTVEVPCHI